MENKILQVSTQTGDLFDECSSDANYIYESFRYLKECGFDAVDYNMDHFIKGNIRTGEIDNFWDKSLEELYAFFAPTKKAAEENGIRFAQAHAAFPLYVEGNDKVNDYLAMSVNKTIAVCAYLGCPALVAHPCKFDDTDKEFEINLEMYRKMMPFAKEYGVKICLENLFNTVNGRPREAVCSTSEEACRYVDILNEEAGEDIFGFCFDIGHANLFGRDLKSFIKKLDKRLTCLHIHDNNGNFDSHMIPYTQRYSKGLYTDWEGMIDGLREINYQGDISFETFRGIGTIPKEAEAEALKLLSAIGRYFRNRILRG